ncbi:MAG: carbohydrate ABC transporter permease [Candidatus Carbobacillus sp.]|nr:carbohydrate ABC transporter permease [Candidatus Carbobacillus sp.]
MLPYFGSGFGTFLLRQSFRSIPQAYEDAARIDGAGFFRIIRHVYVPLSMPTLISFIFFSISFHWNDFFWPLIVTDDDRVRPLTVGLAKFTQAAEAGANWQLIAAGTFIVILPLLVAFVIVLKKARNSITPTLHSGVK